MMYYNDHKILNNINSKNYHEFINSYKIKNSLVDTHPECTYQLIDLANDIEKIEWIKWLDDYHTNSLFKLLSYRPLILNKNLFLFKDKLLNQDHLVYITKEYNDILKRTNSLSIYEFNKIITLSKIIIFNKDNMIETSEINDVIYFEHLNQTPNNKNYHLFFIYKPDILTNLSTKMLLPKYCDGISLATHISQLFYLHKHCPDLVDLKVVRTAIKQPMRYSFAIYYDYFLPLLFNEYKRDAKIQAMLIHRYLDDQVHAGLLKKHLGKANFKELINKINNIFNTLHISLESVSSLDQIEAVVINEKIVISDLEFE